jgi:hypothetical protein
MLFEEWQQESAEWCYKEVLKHAGLAESMTDKGIVFRVRGPEDEERHRIWQACYDQVYEDDVVIPPGSVRDTKKLEKALEYLNKALAIKPGSLPFVIDILRNFHLFFYRELPAEE